MIIKNLTITMKKDLRTLVSGLNLSLSPGDRCAVIGEEGNGKSTLLKLIYDPKLVDSYAEYSGRIQKNNMIAGYLSQELNRKEQSLTAYEYCCGVQGFLDSTPGEIAAAARKLDIPTELFYTDRKLATLSGGEKVKLRMALLLLCRADLFLLDEPSGDLDIETLDWMEQFILSCNAPVLYISHDETLLERTANMVLHIEQLRRKTLPRHVIARTGYRDYVQNRLSAFAHQEQLARKEREDYKKQQDRYRQLYQNVAGDLKSVSRQNPHGGKMLKRKMKAVKSMGRRFEREAEDMTELPDTEEAIMIAFPKGTQVPSGKTVLNFSLDTLEAGEQVLAKDIHLTVKGGAHLCITGRNGAGKTTLLRKIYHELASRGDLKVGYMPQNYMDSMDPAMTPVEFLTDGSRKKDDITQAKIYLGSMKYTPEEFEHSMEALSGGQKAKLFFLKMILCGCNVLLLDEPTRNFSPLSGPVIRKLLRDFEGTIISVSHDRKYIAEVCDLSYSLSV